MDIYLTILYKEKNNQWNIEYQASYEDLVDMFSACMVDPKLKALIQGLVVSDGIESGNIAN